MPDARLGHKLEQRPNGGFRMDWWIETGTGNSSPDVGWVEFHPPHAMSLGIPQERPERQSLLFIWVVPLSENTSRNIVVVRRNFGRYSLIPRIYDLLTPMILTEDRRIQITCWPSEVPSGGEVSMPSDAPSIAFQRWYRSWVAARVP
jgi:hypothetical protein